MHGFFFSSDKRTVGVSVKYVISFLDTTIDHAKLPDCTFVLNIKGMRLYDTLLSDFTKGIIFLHCCCI